MNIQIGEIYTLALGSLLILTLIWHLAAELKRWRYLAFAVYRKHIANNILVARRNGSSSVSIGEALAIMILVGVNAFASSFDVTTLAQLGRRTGVLSFTNLVPLFLGGRTSFWADTLCGIPLSRYGTAHRWLGRICILQGLIHGGVQLSLTAWRFTREYILVTSCLGLIGLTSILYIRRRTFELFLKSHLVLAIGLITLLWLHVQRGRNVQTVCLSLASALWLTQTTAWCFQLAFRNTGGRPRIANSLVSVEVPGAPAVLLRVSLRRPWRVRYGQYVYITVPSVPRKILGQLQAHPYLIAWVNETPGQYSKEVTLLIECRNGFSNRLRLCEDLPHIFVDGPYGTTPSFNNFDKVLFIASGIGIAAHLLAIKYLLHAHEEQTARIRRITLLWVLETKEQEGYARSLLETLIDSDRRRIFTVIICTSSGNSDSNSELSQAGNQDPRRPRLFRPSSVNLEWVIEMEWSAEAGNMAVSLCGAPLFEKLVRAALRSISHDIQLITSPFEMDESARSKDIAKRLTKHVLPGPF